MRRKGKDSPGPQAKTDDQLLAALLLRRKTLKELLDGAQALYNTSNDMVRTVQNRLHRGKKEELSKELRGEVKEELEKPEGLAGVLAEKLHNYSRQDAEIYVSHLVTHIHEVTETCRSKLAAKAIAEKRASDGLRQFVNAASNIMGRHREIGNSSE